MEHKIKFYPVGNADCTLIKLGDGTTILIDCFINNAKDYIKACDAVPKEWNQNWTPKEGFEHLLWCFNHYYERDKRTIY